MSSIKIIKRRIKSATNISKITKAMEMVAASKMRYAQDIALSTRPYTEKMRQILTGIVEIVKHDLTHFLLESPKTLKSEKNLPKKYLIVVLSSDKGLCGGLNSNLFRGLENWQIKFLEQRSNPDNLKLEFITVGKKAKEYALKTKRLLLAEFSSFGDRPHYQDIVPLYNIVFDNFKAGKYQKVFVVFMDFISTISQKLAVKQLLPIEKVTIDTAFQEIMIKEKEKIKLEFHKDYLFEPPAKNIFDKLLPEFLGLYFYHIVLESIASEHSARMVAMKSAHDNARDIVSDLSLEYNQLRQTKITNELLEITSARMVI
ncbi:MAG: ATP synthase F1 subunit gamma [Patescibacteria group bacterium]|nr:ATP synthase F1 subunit gamma [Patescibacteria group bacterium]